MAAGMAGSTTDNGVMAANTAAAGTAECTTAARAGSTGTPNAAHLGHGEIAEGAPACTRHRRLRGTLYIHARSPEPSPYRMNRASSRSAPEKKSRSGSRGACPSPLILGRNVLLPMVLSLLVTIVSTRLRIRPPARGRALTLPPDIQALHPRPSSTNGGIVW
ncbi:hypothetical protein PIB30_085735 [Stylosanthes scabra]|uniref:Uncharacterized protein n=1 Tax=Stylosanthes scabra TaxID=79078 RepID=A0ABU6ST60_9FABA|nr:hypothetical protein [Stylosanthes scabra]